MRPPFELQAILSQVVEIGTNSLILILAAGFALGAIMTFHTRSTLVAFGATALIPAVQALSFFVGIGPLVASLLVAGPVVWGIGAVLANMRATEQIDAMEALSVDAFKLLVVPRVMACVIKLPLLTLFMDFARVSGSFASEYATSHLSLTLYIVRAFTDISWWKFFRRR